MAKAIKSPTKKNVVKKTATKAKTKIISGSVSTKSGELKVSFDLTDVADGIMDLPTENWSVDYVWVKIAKPTSDSLSFTIKSIQVQKVQNDGAPLMQSLLKGPESNVAVPDPDPYIIPRPHKHPLQ